MKKITFYDTETTGFPMWKAPSDDKSQPHIVQICAIQCVDKKPIQSINLIVKPDGWEIPDRVVEIHGITTDHALNVGVSEKLAVSLLSDLCRDSIRVAHNKNFDKRIVRVALKRYSDQRAIDRWSEDDHECTMMMAKPIMQLLPKNNFGFKVPKLIEAYKYFTGKDLKKAHSALADAKACMEIYFAIKKQETA